MPLPTSLVLKNGSNTYQRTRLDKFGFPRGILIEEKTAFGFATGDLVRADVKTGKNAGMHIGRVAIRKSGSFNITVEKTVIQGIAHRHCRRLQRADGYCYHTDLAIPV